MPPLSLVVIDNTNKLFFLVTYLKKLVYRFGLLLPFVLDFFEEK